MSKLTSLLATSFAALTLSLFVAAPAPAASTEEIFRELRQVKALLDLANHDYDGHRHKAVGDVHKALEALEHHFHHHHASQPQNKPAQKTATNTQPKPAPAKPAPAKPAPAKSTQPKKPQETAVSTQPHPHHHHEKQAKSDHQLREARKLLQNLEKQLASSDDIRHQKALIDVAKAVEQIDVALKIR